MANLFTWDTFFGGILSVVLKYMATVVSVIAGLYLLRWKRQRSARQCSIRQYDEVFWQSEQATEWEDVTAETEDVSSMSFRLFSVRDGIYGFLSSTKLPTGFVHTSLQLELRRDYRTYKFLHSSTRKALNHQEGCEKAPPLALTCVKRYGEWQVDFNGTAKMQSGLLKAEKVQVHVTVTWTSTSNPILLNAKSQDTCYHHWGVAKGSVETKSAERTSHFTIGDCSSLRERRISQPRSIASQIGCDALICAFEDASACYLPANGHAYLLMNQSARLCTCERLRSPSSDLNLKLQIGKWECLLCCRQESTFDDWTTRKVVVGSVKGTAKCAGFITSQVLKSQRTFADKQETVRGLVCQEAFSYRT